MNTNTETTRRVAHQPASREYKVVSDRLELPRGSFFFVLSGVPVRSGDLVHFSIGQRQSVGRWFNFGGVDYIRMPGYRINCGDGSRLRIHGQVIPINQPVKQITNLPADEYERFFVNPFPRRLDS